MVLLVQTSNISTHGGFRYNAATGIPNSQLIESPAMDGEKWRKLATRFLGLDIIIIPMHFLHIKTKFVRSIDVTQLFFVGYNIFTEN